MCAGQRMGASRTWEYYREEMPHAPRALGDGYRTSAHASDSGGTSSRESRDVIADSAHLIARGRNADVYLMNDTQVLRRLNTGATTYPNVDLLMHLSALGYPTARILEVDGTDLVMERLHGPNMLQALDAGEVSMGAAVRILLDLHNALHTLPPPTAPRESAERASADGTRSPQPPARGRRPRRRGQISMLHLDLHPGNILLTDSGPQVIDWESARLGSAGVDLATTALVFAEVVVDANEYAAAAHRMLRHFIAAGGAGIAPFLAEAAAVRERHTNLDPVERQLLPEATVVVEQELDRVGA